MYRKREWARGARGRVLYARFRDSDMKEADRGCGGLKTLLSDADVIAAEETTNSSPLP
jgi:hypothetical protein